MMQKLITPTSQEAFINEYIAIKLATTVPVQGSKKEPKEHPGKVKDTELLNPKAKEKLKEYGKSFAALGASYAAGSIVADGVSRLIPKGSAGVAAVLKTTMPFTAIAGVEAVRQYRNYIDEQKKGTAKGATRG